MQTVINQQKEIKEKEIFLKKLEISDIEKFYLNKNQTDLFGLEYERLSLDKNTLQNVPYSKMEKILQNFASIMNWEIIKDDKTIISINSNNGTSISLEPGCQLEVSIAPKKNILDIDLELTKIINLLDNISKVYDVMFLGYGISPVSCVDEIEILDKKRYKIMNDYLPYCKKGEFAPKMMRQSAGIQINIDYKNSKDAFLKLKFLNLIMPFMTGLCSNSPLENNTLTSHRSLRANAWIYTGQERCNLFYKEIFNQKLFKYKNFFKNYIEKVLDVPMVYITRNGENIALRGGITFSKFLKEGYKGYFATIEDYILHQSLCFPDVRLKNYIEIRNHDSNNPKIALALAAFYKGLLSENIEKLLKNFSYLKLKDVEKYNLSAIDFGLDFKVNSKLDGWGVVLKLFNISRKNLTSKERIYLEPILQILKERKTKADIIIDYGIKDAKNLVEFLEG